MFDQTWSGPEPIEPLKRTLVSPTMKSRRDLPPCLAMRAIGWNMEPMLPMNSPSAFITAWFSSTLLRMAMVAMRA